jgi:trehalose 6-phosphate synthase/phosphatase
MSRLLLVSNRLPVTVKHEHGELSVVRSAGGLATGLAGVHGRSEALWIGWPGDTSELGDAERAELDRRLAELGTAPIHLQAGEVRRYYDGFSNGVLWPLFHHLVERAPLHMDEWEDYRTVNQRFADVTAEHYRPGDVVWVHDYQLALVPALLRRRLPRARIGFFLHIPFPAVEIFRILPAREALLDGLLGADLIGFHTAAYARHFADALLHVLGVAAGAGLAGWRGRAVRFGAFPMGIDAASFASLASSAEVEAGAAAIRGEAAGRRLLLGIDRLDYTKGIPRRLLAVERLLEQDPSMRALRFVQVVVPSRMQVDEYKALEAQVNELVGRINGAYGTLEGAPVHYLFQSFAPSLLCAMYRAADVMLVTPLCDGMNLVAKEFVACRVDGDGVLVLSEFAGAACELGEALLVNPYDIDATAAAIARALGMPEGERRARMRALRERVFSHDVSRWAGAFLGELGRAGAALEDAGPDMAPRRVSSPGEIEGLVERLGRAERLLLLLDYDGTLATFTGRPELAAPDPELRALLAALARRPGTRVHVISGRPREVLDRWLGALAVGLHAEHGLWSRRPGRPWTATRRPDTAWKDRIGEVMRRFATATPGAFVEEKTAGIAWHHRMCDPEVGAAQAEALEATLKRTFRDEPVEVLHGDEVVEVRPRGIHKGLVLEGLRDEARGAAILAMGDDRTDEDLFAALPEGAAAIHVGPRPSRAPLRVADVDAARAVLRGLLDVPAASVRRAA